MKARTFRRALCLALVCVMTSALLAGCALGVGGKSAPVMADKDHVYSCDYITVPDMLTGVNSFCVAGDTVYLNGYYSGEVKNADGNIEWVYEDVMVSMDIATRTFTEMSMDLKANPEADVYVTQMVADPAGGMWVVCEEYSYSYDENDPDSYEYTDIFYLVKLDSTGKELARVNLSEVLANEQNGGYVYVNQLVVSGGYIYALSDNVLCVLDAAGKLVRTLEMGDGWANSMLAYKDEGVMLSFYDYSTSKDTLLTLDNPQQESFAVLELVGDVDLSNYTFCGAVEGYDTLMYNRTGMYGYVFETGERTLLCNWVDSNVNGGDMYNIGVISAEQFISSGYDSITNEQVVYMLNKVAPEDVQDKVQITLASRYLDYDVMTEVIRFNRASDKYRVTIKSYSDEYGYEQAQARLNADVASGLVPDILLIDSQMPVDSYNSKGLFVDLFTLIEADEELSREDILPEILSVMTTSNGKLYQMIPSFYLQTYVADSRFCTGADEWTLDAVAKVLAEVGDEYALQDYMTQADFLNYSIMFGGDAFVSGETGECHFDSAEFKKLLEMAATMPTEEELFGDGEMGVYSSAASSIAMPMPEPGSRPNRIMMDCYIDSFYSYNYARYNFGKLGNAVFCGFPTAEGGKGAITANTVFSISAKSASREGAWAFLRSMLLDDYQCELEWRFPVTEKAFAELAEEAKKPRTHINYETGEEEEYYEEYWDGENSIPMELLTDKDIADFRAMLGSSLGMMNYDYSLFEIINEEASAFFAGQKSADEVAGIIQSRAQIYISENR